MKREIYPNMPEGFKHYNTRKAMYDHSCDMCEAQIWSRRATGVKYCSAKCRKRASIGHKTWNDMYVCKHCGGQFSTPQPFQHPEYCSNACKQSAYRKRKVAK